ncbi:hypothetical protein K7432_006957 [Basidiobolus ranarum]
MYRRRNPYWPEVFSTVILIVSLSIIIPSEAIIISPSKVALFSHQDPYFLTQFAFGEGGQGRLSMGNFIGIPENGYDRFFKVIVVERKDWSTMIDMSHSWGQNYCAINSSYWGESTLYFDTFKLEKLRNPLNIGDPAITFTIRAPGAYNILFLNCGGIGVKFSVYGSFFNIIDGRITHLPICSVPLPTIYLVFGLGIWPLILLPWIINWYKHREMKITIHWLLSLYPVLQILFCLFSAFAFSYMSQIGENPGWLEVFRGFLVFATSYLYFLFRLAISKGYGITRMKLTSQENRVIFGVALFVAAAEASQQIIGGATVAAVSVFYFITYFYVYWNSRIHLKLLRFYIRKLREKSSTELLVKAYVNKFQLIL